MRVRTYGFPGCFTRPPGTSTRHHPHEPTTSKPVVPGDVLPLQCTESPDQICTGWAVQREASGRRGKTRAHTKRDAVPSHFEEPGGSGRRAFPCGWRGLTPQWPRSLRLGSASGFNLTRYPPRCNPPLHIHPAFSEKMRFRNRPRVPAAGRPRGARRTGACGSLYRALLHP